MGNHCGNLIGCGTSDTELQNSLEHNLDEIRGKRIVTAHHDIASIIQRESEHSETGSTGSHERKLTIEMIDEEDEGEPDENP